MQKPEKIVIASQHYPPDQSTTAAIMSAISHQLAADAPVLVLSGMAGSALVRQDTANLNVIEIKNRNSALDETLEKLISRGVGLCNTITRLERLYGSRQAFMMRNLSPRGVVVSLSIPARPLPLEITEFETQAVG